MLSQRHALGLLFTFITAAFAGIAIAAGGAGRWPVAFAAGALAAWMGTLAFKALRRS